MNIMMGQVGLSGILVMVAFIHLVKGSARGSPQVEKKLVHHITQKMHQDITINFQNNKFSPTTLKPGNGHPSCYQKRSAAYSDSPFTQSVRNKVGYLFGGYVVPENDFFRVRRCSLMRTHSASHYR